MFRDRGGAAKSCLQTIVLELLGLLTSCIPLRSDSEGRSISCCEQHVPCSPANLPCSATQNSLLRCIGNSRVGSCSDASFCAAIRTRVPVLAPFPCQQEKRGTRDRFSDDWIVAKLWHTAVKRGASLARAPAKHGSRELRRPAVDAIILFQSTRAATLELAAHPCALSALPARSGDRNCGREGDGGTVSMAAGR